MNKRNKILVGCLALLLVLSVGYALYSETITINGTATAKVNFDIETTCEVTTSNTADPKGIYTIGGTGNCEIEDGIIKTTSTLNKPGDMVVYKVNIKNAGTIPALLETVVSSNNSYDDGTPGGDEAYYDSTKSLMAAFGIGGDVGSVSQMVSAKAVFEPDFSVDFYIYHSWISKDPQPELPSNGAVINYDLSFGFVQVTN